MLIQFNGKCVGEYVDNLDISNEELETRIRTDKDIINALNEMNYTIKKIVIIPKKLANVVVESKEIKNG